MSSGAPSHSLPQADCPAADVLDRCAKAVGAADGVTWTGTHIQYRSVESEARPAEHYRALAAACLYALLPIPQDVINAMADTPGMMEVDGMISRVAARNTRDILGWRHRGEQPPLVQAFEAAIRAIAAGQPAEANSTGRRANQIDAPSPPQGQDG